MATTGTAKNDILRGTTNSDTLQGLEGRDILYGLAGNDTLDGGLGADQLFGGQGFDTYIVDNKGDTVTELENQGYDTVMASISFTLGAHLENLTLTGKLAIDGTGNGLGNVLIGNDAANRLVGLDGNDALDGGKGADRLVGGLGDDTYVVDNQGDTVKELAVQGSDTVQASVSFVLGSHIENLTLAGDAAIDGAGNDLANTLTGNTAVNSLNGGDGNDLLNGMQGADKLAGGPGNDTYIVDDNGDSVTELASQGIDTVKSSVDFTLGANLENLTLAGAVNGKGNSLANTLEGDYSANSLTGGGGNDTLKGGGGLDTLSGGADNDTLVVADSSFQSVNGGAGNDKLVFAFDGNIDLASLAGKATNIESVTLEGAHNALAPAAQNVLDMTDGRDTLTVNGDAGDSVVISGGWTPQGTKGGYQLFTQLGATLKVETGLSTYTNLYVIHDGASAAEASTHLTAGADLVEINLGGKSWNTLQDFSLAGFGPEDKLRINTADGQAHHQSPDAASVLANGDWLKTNHQVSVTYQYFSHSTFTSTTARDTILAGPKQLTLRSWSRFGSGTHTVHVTGLPDALAPSQVEFF